MLQIIKTRLTKDPVRDVEENAGIDIYIPENTDDFRHALVEKNKDYVIVDHEPVMSQERLRQQFGYGYICAANGIIHIPPHKAVVIPTGIKSKFGPELALIANNKSGIATKKQLIFGASVVDASYQGEWHVHLINSSDEWQTVECGQKAIQFIPHLISTEKLEILDVPEKEFYKKKTSRGSGWAGSTGLK